MQFCQVIEVLGKENGDEFDTGMVLQQWKRWKQRNAYNELCVMNLMVLL